MSDDDTKQEESFAELLDGYMAREPIVRAGEEVEAKVISIGPEYAVLDLGTRSEGMLARDEVTKDEELTVAPGDRLKVFITSVFEGSVMCALRIGGASGNQRPGDKEMALAQLAEARENGVPVEGTVKEAIKGGFTVTVMGLRAFCPISQIDNAFTDNPEEHVGRSYSFAVRQVDERGRNIVVSRRELLKAESEKAARDLWETLEVGAVFEGTVKTLQKYGAFVDIGGVEGLVHVSEISYERVEDPGTILTVGQSVRVAIKDMDPERKRIGLSLKAMLEDPWLEVPSQLPLDSVHTGKVVRIAPFGAFVELLRGVDGLVHISELGGGRRINNPREIVKEGDEVEVRVKEVDVERRRVSLALANAADADPDAASSASAAEVREALSQPGAGQSGGFGTFGDLFAKNLKK